MLLILFELCNLFTIISVMYVIFHELMYVIYLVCDFVKIMYYILILNNSVFSGQMSGEFPCATSDAQSMQTTSDPMGQSEKVHSLPYADPKQPGIELTRSDGSISLFMVIMNSLNENIFLLQFLQEF